MASRPPAILLRPPFQEPKTAVGITGHRNRIHRRGTALIWNVDARFRSRTASSACRDHVPVIPLGTVAVRAVSIVTDLGCFPTRSAHLMKGHPMPPNGTSTRDGLRATAVVLAVILQTVAGGIGGLGAWGESVGVVANSYPQPLLPSGAAFSIWSLIYVATLAYAIRQALPQQRRRPLHRRTGWWIAAAGVLNAAWIASFAHRLIPLSELVIVLMLTCLLIAYARLEPADGWPDRLFTHLPVALYAGWVSIATVVGAVTVAVWAGARVSAGGAVAVLAVTVVLVGWVIARRRVVLAYAAPVVWAAVWVAVAADGLVRYSALAAALLLAAWTGWRIARDPDRVGVAAGLATIGGRCLPG